MSQHVLVKVHYNEQKKEIICYFKNALGQEAKRFPFTPYIKLPIQFQKDSVEFFLNEFKIKNFIIKEDKIFSNISTLKKISKIIGQLTNKKFVVLSQERIFLLEKQWTYFDSFDLNTMQKVPFEIELIKQALFQNMSFEEYYRLDKDFTKNIIKKAAFSSLLKIPLNEINLDISSITENFFENMFFYNALNISWKNEDSFYSMKEFVPFYEFEYVSKIDFSLVWSKLLTNSFSNLGIDTLNCACCKPIKLDDKQLLPSSLIEVIFKEDIFYISKLDSFALNFHKKNNYKKERLEKKKEFFLKNWPVGPFKKEDKQKLPLCDVKQLLSENKVFLSNNHSLFWSCLNKEASLSKEINTLNFSSPVDFTKLFSISFKELFFNELNKAKKSLLSNIPYHLTNPLSNFFSPSLAKSIIALQEETLSKFTEFSEKNGYRVLFSHPRKVFIKGFSSLALTKKFSKETALPQPIIASFSKKSFLK